MRIVRARRHLHRPPDYRPIGIVAVLLALVMSIPGQAYRHGSSQFPESGGDEKRSFDARVARTSLADVAPTDRQRIGIEALRQDVRDLDVSFDPRMGATEGLWNGAGFVSDPDGRSTMESADSYSARSLDSLGLLPTGVADREVTDVVYSKVTGATQYSVPMSPSVSAR